MLTSMESSKSKKRAISMTEKSSDSQKTQTTLYIPNTSGEFAASMQVNEQQRHH
jgi:hypothetical protein